MLMTLAGRRQTGLQDFGNRKGNTGESLSTERLHSVPAQLLLKLIKTISAPMPLVLN